jgi:hypothetical protein
LADTVEPPAPLTVLDRRAAVIADEVLVVLGVGMRR